MSDDASTMDVDQINGTSSQHEDCSSNDTFPYEKTKQGRFRRIFKNLRLRKKVNTKEKIETPQPIKEKCHKTKFASFLSFFKRRSNKVGVWAGEPTHAVKLVKRTRRGNVMREKAERMREYLRWKLICSGGKSLDSEDDEKHEWMKKEADEVPLSVAFEISLNEPNSRSSTPMPGEPSKDLRRARPSLAQINRKMVRARELRLQKQLSSVRPQLEKRINVTKKRIDLKLMEELRAKEQTEHINAKMKRAEESRQRQFAERIRPESARRERVQQNKKEILLKQQKEQQTQKENLEKKLKMADSKRDELAKERSEHVDKLKDHAEGVIIAKLELERNECTKRNEQLALSNQGLAAKASRKQLKADARVRKLKDKHALVEERCKAKAKERSLPALRLPNQQASERFMLQLIEQKLIKEREEIKSRSGFRAEDEPRFFTSPIDCFQSPSNEMIRRDVNDDAMKDGSDGSEPWPPSF